jgi:hypothetical protein
MGNILRNQGSTIPSTITTDDTTTKSDIAKDITKFQDIINERYKAIDAMTKSILESNQSEPIQKFIQDQVNEERTGIREICQHIAKLNAGRRDLHSGSYLEAFEFGLMIAKKGGMPKLSQLVNGGACLLKGFNCSKGGRAINRCHILACEWVEDSTNTDDLRKKVFEWHYRQPTDGRMWNMHGACNLIPLCDYHHFKFDAHAFTLCYDLTQKRIQAATVKISGLEAKQAQSLVNAVDKLNRRINAIEGGYNASGIVPLDLRSLSKRSISIRQQQAMLLAGTSIHSSITTSIQRESDVDPTIDTEFNRAAKRSKSF